MYITYAKRTAIGAFLGSLTEMPAHLLGARLIENLLAETGLDPVAIDEVILGQVLTGGAGQNPARQALIHGGLPVTIPGMTINKVCGSGLKSIALAASSIKAGDGELIIAGGQETMSGAMHAVYLRNGQKFGEAQLIDLLKYDGLTDSFSQILMGITAENVARKFNISREAQDNLALNSQLKAAKAQKEGRFGAEILPVSIQKGKEKIIFASDESIRADSTYEVLSKLKPVFIKDESASVTAGNSSPISDGAACVLVASDKAITRHNLTPLVRIVSYASCGVDPNIMGIAPINATKLALVKAGWRVKDLDLIEANEAFAAQSCYVNQESDFDPDKVNVNGGAIALGHPIGASGARILVTLIHEMSRIKAKKGLATLCIGGGMGIAMCIELC